MSSQSWKRIPRTLQYMLRLYETASNSLSVYSNQDVRTFLQRNSQEYKFFQRYKLIRSNEFDNSAFPPIMAESIKPYFDDKLKFNSIDDIPTKELFNIPKNDMLDSDDSIHTMYSRTVTQSSDYFASLISLFSSTLSPRTEVPNITSLQNSFKWYTKLLNNTPIIFFLSQKHRLFSNTSLSKIDKAYLDLEYEITEIANDLGKNVDRSYHFTKLGLIDIFNLAVKHQDKFYKQNINDFDEILSTINWQDCEDDGLCESLMSHKLYEIIDSKFKPVSQETLDYYLNQNKFERLKRAFINKRAISALPYDLIYSTTYMLCIEDSVIDGDYSRILQTIKSSDFEIIGARLSLDNRVILENIPRTIEAAENTTGYDTLLQKAKTDRTKEPSIKSLFSFIGQTNLVTVELNNNESSVYFLPPKNPSS
ncbi:hypothetical protein DFJ63DRAFT_37234 [Scheffersomyces coipomensis]|uniref:uncharacterized protein n=1 Tax=Scheffersomyces coipomensis TaxID=1788519 RepID=UPI00315DBDC7